MNPPTFSGIAKQGTEPERERERETEGGSKRESKRGILLEKIINKYNFPIYISFENKCHKSYISISLETKKLIKTIYFDTVLQLNTPLLLLTAFSIIC